MSKDSLIVKAINARKLSEAFGETSKSGPDQKAHWDVVRHEVPELALTHPLVIDADGPCGAYDDGIAGEDSIRFNVPGYYTECELRRNGAGIERSAAQVAWDEKTCKKALKLLKGLQGDMQKSNAAQLEVAIEMFKTMKEARQNIGVALKHLSVKSPA